MSKTNKFRAFYKPDFTTPGGPLLFEQKIVDDELFFVCKKDSEIKYNFSIPFLDDNWVLQQFTGLKDKNGVEIFEGDILSVIVLNKGIISKEEIESQFYKKNNYVIQKMLVEFGEDGYYATTTITKDFGGSIIPETSEIIGNFFENPEILGQNKS